ncbi:MAG: hypothetical protein HOL01_07150 [Planctomycetaceae bacterium]|nr:hypothetical protein [Planctomycetaceae bacterium]MBT6486907.1 hypothetical protein [Planctomycetaceae bacterium]MBT6494317.1 hypothetical protein [Planctomycetaceae bacterium]
MSEDSGRLELDGDVIQYTSTTYPDWIIRIADIRIIGEATNQNGPFADDYVLCFCTGPGMWHEASFYAEGRDSFLTALGARLGAPLQLCLASSSDFASRILWPVEFVDKPMFKYEDVPPITVVDRLLGPMRNWQTYSDHALEALNK